MTTKRLFFLITTIIVSFFILTKFLMDKDRHQEAGFNPGIKCHIKFNGGIEFLGLDLQGLSDGLYRISYFWRLKKKLIDKVCVFVHFMKNGEIFLQNDHPLLEQNESYMIKIPPGEYTVKLGLWLPDKGGRRLKILGSRDTSIEVGKVNVEPNRLLMGLKVRIIFQSDETGNKEIYAMVIDGSDKKQLISTHGESKYANFSPDGKDVVFQSNRDGNNEIYIMDSDGGNQINLTNNPADDISPSWHPDSNRIIFVSDREGAMNFYLIDRDGSNLTKVTDFVDGVHDMPRISPDGEEIIFTSNMSMGWQIFKVGIDGKNLQRLSNLLSGHCEGIWAHRSNKILFVSRLGGNSEIYVMDRDGSNEQRLTTHDALDYNPRFSPDDKNIIFSSERDGNWELYIMDINNQKPIRVTYTDSQEEWPDWIYE